MNLDSEDPERMINAPSPVFVRTLFVHSSYIVRIHTKKLLLKCEQ